MYTRKHNLQIHGKALTLTYNRMTKDTRCRQSTGGRGLDFKQDMVYPPQGPFSKERDLTQIAHCRA